MIDRVREGLVGPLGAGGDGIIDGEHGRVFIPFTLPGEKVSYSQSEDRGQLLKILEACGHRITPACKHFTTCGGCSLQHMERSAYLEWKRGKVRSALLARGIDVDVDPVRPVKDESRRRCVLSARRTRKLVMLGFHAQRSDEIVDIAHCPVMRPTIIAAFEGLKEIAGLLLSRRGQARIHVLESLSGLDVSIEDVKPVEGASLRSQLAEMAKKLNLARLTVEQEIIVTRRDPVIEFANAKIIPPPGAFLQATSESEAEMTSLILEGCGEAQNIADLFAGIGTFTFPLAKNAAVTALEYDGFALEALDRAARGAQGFKPIQVMERDLMKEPLAGAELNMFEAVIFDPPRAGARAQAECLAVSDIPLIVAVSCNPATLARDARILIDGGYKIARVTPVDQFLYSSHIEMVAHFKRP